MPCQIISFFEGEVWYFPVLLKQNVMRSKIWIELNTSALLCMIQIIMYNGRILRKTIFGVTGLRMSVVVPWEQNFKLPT